MDSKSRSSECLFFFWGGGEVFYYRYTVLTTVVEGLPVPTLLADTTSQAHLIGNLFACTFAAGHYINLKLGSARFDLLVVLGALFAKMKSSADAFLKTQLVHGALVAYNKEARVLNRKEFSKGTVCCVF